MALLVLARALTSNLDCRWAGRLPGPPVTLTTYRPGNARSHPDASSSNLPFPTTDATSALVPDLAGGAAYRFSGSQADGGGLPSKRNHSLVRGSR